MTDSTLSQTLQRLTPKQRDLLLRRMQQRAATVESSIEIGKDCRCAPLSSAQLSIWAFEQMFPATTVYHVNLIERLSGHLNISLFEQSVAAIIKRHDILQTAIEMQNDIPVQCVSHSMTARIDKVSLDSHVDGSDEVVARLIDEHASQPFDLARGPLFRLLLITLTGDSHVILISMHHMISDGHSLKILMRELWGHYGALLEGAPFTQPFPAIQYRDYAVWQSKWMKSPEKEEQLTYWRKHLAGIPSTELPLSKERPAVQTFHGDVIDMQLSHQDTTRLRVFSQQERTTPFVVLLSAFNILLSAYTDQRDIVVGIPVEGRVRPETQDVIGCFVNSVVLRTIVPPEATFRQLVASVREVVRSALVNQDLPFEELIRELRPERDPSRHPLFQIFFNLLPLRDESASTANVVTTPIKARTEHAKFDLSVYIDDLIITLHIRVVYKTDLYSRDFIEGVSTQFVSLLTECLTSPEEKVCLLASSTLRAKVAAQLSVMHSVHGRDEPSESGISLSSAFERTVLKNPMAHAVTVGSQAWTYEELNREANRIAALLAAECSKTQRVAIICESDPPTLAAILGILKSNAAFVPLDPNHPPDRLAHIVHETRPTAILAQAAHHQLAKYICGSSRPIIMGNLSIDDRQMNPTAAVADDALAYILFTSGSTGVPKGVVQNHRNVLHHVTTYARRLNIGPNDRLSIISSFCFDAAIMDIFGALLSGAAVYPLNLRRESPARLSEWICDNKITIFHSTPTVYRYCLETKSSKIELNSVRAVVLGGEEAHRDDFELFKQHFPKSSVFVNGYGPTESTLALQCVLTHADMIERPKIPIGHPVENTTIELVGKSDLGSSSNVGEIVICSSAVALGYWGQETGANPVFESDLTNSAVRRYRTGDLARVLSDGSLEFVGRTDTQLKIRGQRVELAEIEHVLRRQPGISKCAVVAGDVRGVAQITAYVVLSTGKLDVECLKHALRSFLPEFMLPASIVQIPELPLRDNGKVNIELLPQPPEASSHSGGLAPRTPLERDIERLWAELLQVDAVSVERNFFDLGGHSLLLIKLHRRLCGVLHVDFPLMQLFRAPTIAEQARVIGSVIEIGEHLAQEASTRGGYQ